MNPENMSVDQLRTEARRLNAVGQFRAPAGVSHIGKWINIASKTALVDAIYGSFQHMEFTDAATNEDPAAWIDTDDDAPVVINPPRHQIAAGQSELAPAAEQPHEPDALELADTDEEPEEDTENSPVSDIDDNPDLDPQSPAEAQNQEESDQNDDSDDSEPETSDGQSQPESQDHPLLAQLAKFIAEHTPEQVAPPPSSNLNENELMIRLDILQQSAGELMAASQNIASKLAEHEKRFETLETVQRIEITVNNNGHGSHTITGIVHKTLPELLNTLAIREPAMIIGPAASGKTMACKQAAEALGVEFYPYSCGPEMSQYSLFGFIDASGTYQPGILYKPFTEGGLLLLDEIDRSNPAVLTSLNAAVDNKFCSFPTGVVTAHDDFICVAAANTYGAGYDHDYVGATRLDGSTLDRFTRIYWGYDEQMEKDLFGATPWTKYVQAARKSAQQAGIKVILSPRASRRGNKMLSTKQELNKAFSMLFAGIDATSRQRIESGISDATKQQLNNYAAKLQAAHD